MEPKSHFVRVGDIRLHYVDWGRNGPPVLFHHGGQRTSRSWDALAEGLSRDFWVLSLDARGHGLSDWPERGYSQGQRVADLNGFLDALGLTELFGVGHSSGGSTFTLYAAQHPGRFRRLVLIEPLIVATPGSSDGYLRRMQNTRRLWASRDDLLKTLQGHPETRKWREDVMHDVAQKEARQHPDGSVEMMWNPNIYHPEDRGKDVFSLIEVAPTVPVPVLVMAGTASRFNYEEARRLAAAFPQGSFELVEGAGHNIYMERPEVVERAARGFFGAAKAAPATEQAPRTTSA